nr:hypothetical protein [Streptomyces sp. SID5468]
MSRQDALDWARRFTEEAAGAAGLELEPGSPDSLFGPCFGKHGETSTDERFQLMYSAYSPLPVEHHTAAVDKIRAALEREGYTITGYRPYGGPRVSAIVEATAPDNRFTVSVESAGKPPAPPTKLSFGVDTTCLIPPTATQSPQ